MLRKTFAASLIGLLLPFSAAAATFSSGDTYALGNGEKLAGDLYAASGSVSVGGDVTGDVYAAGGSVVVTGTVSQDLVVAGGNVTLLGSVGDDVRAAGGQLTISGKIGGDLIAVGGIIHLLPGSEVAGDLIFSGGQIVVEGAVKGKMVVRGGVAVLNGTLAGPADVEVDEKLSIGDAARLAGPLVYRAPDEASVAAGAKTGEVRREPLPELARTEQPDASEVAGGLAGIVTLIAFGKLLAALGGALVAVWFFRKGTQQLVTSAVDAFWPTVLRGFAAVILMPIAAVLLLVTVVLSPIGALTGAAFALLLIAAKILSGVLLGAWLFMIVKKQKTAEVSWLTALVGTLLINVLWMIPIIGGFVCAIFILAAFGALVAWSRSLLKPLAAS